MLAIFCPIIPIRSYGYLWEFRKIGQLKMEQKRAPRLLTFVIAGIVFILPLESRSADKKSKSSFSYDLEAGVRGIFQYQFNKGIMTPPPMAASEASIGLWYKEQGAVYCFYDYSVALEKFQGFGFGFKVPVAGFSNQTQPLFDSPHIFFILDWMNYSFASIPAGVSYPSSGSILRWGFALHLNFGQTGVYFNLEVMGTRWADNLMLAPLLGLGVHL